MTQEEFAQVIYVSHPIESIRANQKALLETCPSDQVEFHRLMLLYGNATYRYSDQASGNVTHVDYEDWLEGLPEDIARSFRKEGFESSRSSLSLRRHSLERRDLGMGEFVAELIKPEDLAKWRQLVDKSTIGEGK